METFNIEAVEQQHIVITLTLADKEGTPANLDEYSVYAASAGIINPYDLKPRRDAWTSTKNEEGTAYVLTSPGHDIPHGPWKYCIYIKQLATGLEWAAVGGKITLQMRTTEEEGGISPATYSVQAETAVSGMVHCVLDSSAAALGSMVAAAEQAAEAAKTSADRANAAVTDAETAAQQASDAQQTVATYAAAATASADRAAQQATEATSAATAAGTAATDADAAKTAAETALASAQSARDVCIQSAATMDAHASTAATASALGHVKLSTDTVYESSASAPIGVLSTGQIVVPMATMSTFGSVKKSSQTGTSVPCIGINNAGQMVLNVRASHSGFEQVNNTVYIQTSTDEHPTNGNEATACVATDTAGKLSVPPATTTKAGGVIIATGSDDTRATAVATAAQLAALEARVAALETA